MCKLKIIICAFLICAVLSGCTKTYYNDNEGYSLEYNTDTWKITSDDDYDAVVSNTSDTAKIGIRIDDLGSDDVTLEQLNEFYAKYISYGQVNVQKIIIDGYEGVLLKSEPIEEREFEPWEIRNIFAVSKDGRGYAFFYYAQDEQSQNDYFSSADELLTGFSFTK